MISNEDGILEFIEYGVDGLIVGQGDSRQLADTIETLLKNEGLRKKFGENARMVVEKKFNIQKNVADLIAIFKNQILHPKGWSMSYRLGRS